MNEKMNIFNLKTIENKWQVLTLSFSISLANSDCILKASCILFANNQLFMLRFLHYRKFVNFHRLNHVAVSVVHRMHWCFFCQWDYNRVFSFIREACAGIRCCVFDTATFRAFEDAQKAVIFASNRIFRANKVLAIKQADIHIQWAQFISNNGCPW